MDRTTKDKYRRTTGNFVARIVSPRRRTASTVIEHELRGTTRNFHPAQILKEESRTTGTITYPQVGNIGSCDVPLVRPPESHPLGHFKNRSFLPRYALCWRRLQGRQEWRARCTQRFRRAGVASCLRGIKGERGNITAGRVDKHFCESVG